MNLQDFWTLSGWLVGVASLIIAVFQIRKTKRIHERNLEQMLVFLDRVNFVSFEYELVDEATQRLGDNVLLRHITSWHQAGCDLYISMVDYYLSLRESFTWNDLKKICDTPIVSYSWQEEKWRTLVSHRKENMKAVVPEERYLKVEKKPRLRTFQQKCEPQH